MKLTRYDFSTLLPKAPGSYILHLHADRELCIQVGRLGCFDLIPGDYLYVGSAHGPGGLKGRLTRQLSPTGRRHWHIDYLRQHLELRSIWFRTGRETLECRWASALSNLADDPQPVPGFGSSDCRCPTHLTFLHLLSDEHVLKITSSLGC